uniref:Uncharacterized protein n=1 Tax=Glossina morsitans morsitans TaxID=37546 RepID=A0A1B0F9F5_GLOMM
MDMVKVLNNIGESPAYEQKIMSLKDFPKDKRLRILSAERKQARYAKPNFHSSPKISDDMIAIQMNKVRVEYNKPIYIGFTVLELSKWKMYNFHYDYMKPKYKENINLNYMDTDSFIYDIETNDLYEDIGDDINYHFDTSAYPKENIFNFPLLNNRVLGMMKDECNGKIMKEFIDLRPKMYSFKIDEDGGETDPPVANPPSADNAVNIGTKGRKPPSFGIGITLGIAAAALLLLLILNFECIAF